MCTDNGFFLLSSLSCYVSYQLIFVLIILSHTVLNDLLTHVLLNRLIFVEFLQFMLVPNGELYRRKVWR